MHAVEIGDYLTLATQFFVPLDFLSMGLVCIHASWGEGGLWRPSRGPNRLKIWACEIVGTHFCPTNVELKSS